MKTKVKPEPVLNKDGPPICKDFDGDCFKVLDKQKCLNSGGKITEINGEYYYVEYSGICPFL